MALTESELNNNGWVYSYFYAAGNESMFVNNRGLNLRVAKDFSYALTYCGSQMRQIENVNDLIEYEKTGK